ncbi:hypothetical protein [Vibrio brasiliensis]|uniref:hypothetical protein n=1 Tax=Vibrio brasiliensis TaxID=170652 RepID=UPI001EFD618B|nr:hypothetical protein [Vibrio brasiliensis]MCG9727518.1 hypothetical protein [Vibrio brasiliensis]
MKKKIWTGTITGTNIGNVFLILEHEGNDVSGSLTINDINFGVADYIVHGKLNNEKVKLLGTPTNSSTMASIVNNIAYGSITIEGKVSGQEIKGIWESSIGTKGVFSIEEQVI